MDAFAEAVERQRQEALARMHAVRISVLIWGPAPATSGPVGRTRAELRATLEADGHLVRYSEDLYDPNAGYSILAQQVADVEAHDITFSLPDTPGSIAEDHDFARIRERVEALRWLTCSKTSRIQSTTWSGIAKGRADIGNIVLSLTFLLPPFRRSGCGTHLCHKGTSRS